MENKRNSKRINFKERVKYGNTDRPNTEGYSYNISKNGIAIKSYKALTPGSKVSVVLYSGKNPIYDSKGKLCGTLLQIKALRLKWELEF